eukprot:15475943-Alexandrium_andersonii.AAC.1
MAAAAGGDGCGGDRGDARSCDHGHDHHGERGSETGVVCVYDRVHDRGGCECRGDRRGGDGAHEH